MTPLHLRDTRVSTATLVVLVACVAASGGTLLAAGTATADHTDDGGAGDYVATQGDACVGLATLGDGSTTVSQFYDYRYGSGTSFASYGTTHLQDTDVSQVFVYHGPDGESLVFLHGELDGGGGGGITMSFSGLPEGTWPVVDDSYPEPDDRFQHDGSTARIDWMWAPNRTDGAAFSGLGGLEDGDAITVDPAFGEASYAHSQRNWPHVSGDVGWYVRHGDAPGDLTSVAEDEPLTVERGSCEESSVSAAAAADASTVAVGDTVTVDGSASSADGTEIESHEWTFDDGTAATGPTAEHAYDEPGTYAVELTVTAADGTTDATTVSIEVTGSDDGDENDTDDGGADEGDSGDGDDGSTDDGGAEDGDGDDGSGSGDDSDGSDSDGGDGNADDGESNDGSDGSDSDDGSSDGSGGGSDDSSDADDGSSGESDGSNGSDGEGGENSSGDGSSDGDSNDGPNDGSSDGDAGDSDDGNGDGSSGDGSGDDDSSGDDSDGDDSSDDSNQDSPGDGFGGGPDSNDGATDDGDADDASVDDTTAGDADDGEGHDGDAGEADESGSDGETDSDDESDDGTDEESDDGEVRVADLSVEQPTVAPGEDVVVTATFENTGSTAATNATLTVGGERVAAENVTVPAGESQTVSFTHRIGSSGTYDVGVGGEQQTVTVEDVGTGGERQNSDGAAASSVPGGSTALVVAVVGIVALLGVGRWVVR